MVPVHTNRQKRGTERDARRDEREERAVRERDGMHTSLSCRGRRRDVSAVHLSMTLSIT